MVKLTLRGMHRGEKKKSLPAVALGQRTKIEHGIILSGANELERRAPLFSAHRDDYEGISFDFGQIQILAAKIPLAPNL